MTELNVSHIQHFSVGDGDGIRTTVFLKGCNLFCPWCHNPEAMTNREVLLKYKNGRSEISGRRMSISDVAGEVMADIDFYERGGGLTVSGGECLLQYEGVYELFCEVKKRAAKENKKMTCAVDTAGCVPRGNIERLISCTDFWLFDLKTAEGEKYSSVGGDMELVLKNLELLIENGADVRIRIPLIPGFNTAAEDVEKIVAKTAELGISFVDLLPFHRLGTAKYEAMGLEYSYGDVLPVTVAQAEEIAEIFRRNNISARIEK